MSNLYEINKEINEILEMEDIEDVEAMGKKFLELEQAKEEKITNTIKWINSINADSVAIDEEIKRLKELKDNKKSRVERAKGLIEYVLAGEEYETALFKISYRKSERVIVDEEVISKEYMKEKTTFSPDKTAIKKAIKDGKEIDGAFIEVLNNLKIK